jgi:hypothetical protein
MIQLSDIFAVAKQVNDSLTSSNLQAEIQNLTRTRPIVQQGKENGLQQVNAVIDKLIGIVTSVNIGPWTTNQEEVLQKLEISNLVGENGRKFLNDLKTQIKTNIANAPAIIQGAVQELNKLRTKPTQVFTLLQPFSITETVSMLSDNEGVIEIVFDGDVAIDDFTEAKEQMEDWFIIIEGYARLLGVRREDFEIISISKSSPSKFKIKTTLKNVTLVLGIVSAVLLIEKTVLENKLMIEKLRQTPIISDSTFHKQYIDKATEEIQSKVTEGIDKIVDEKIKEHEVPEGNGDIKTVLSKGIQYQYNFIINGGNVNIHVINGQVQQQVDSLEKSKVELKLIKENYENQKALNENNNDTTLDGQ